MKNKSYDTSLVFKLDPHVHMCMCMFLAIRVCTHVHVYVGVCMYACTYVRMYVCACRGQTPFKDILVILDNQYKC